MPPKKRKSIGQRTPAAQKKKAMRALETLEQREYRLQQGRIRASTSRARETSEEREIRLLQCRVRASETRARAKERALRLHKQQFQESASAQETSQERELRLVWNRYDANALLCISRDSSSVWKQRRMWNEHSEVDQFPVENMKVEFESITVKEENTFEETDDLTEAISHNLVAVKTEVVEENADEGEGNYNDAELMPFASIDIKNEEEETEENSDEELLPLESIDVPAIKAEVFENDDEDKEKEEKPKNETVKGLSLCNLQQKLKMAFKKNTERKGRRNIRDLCGNIAGTFYSLQQGLNIDGGMDDPLKCIVCGVVFDCSKKYNQHVIMHAKKRERQCPICGKQFDSLSNLKEHSSLHTGERPFKCDICSKTFLQAGSLKYHFRIHTGEKPYLCDACGKTFRGMSDLKMHLLTHLYKDAYKCQYCFQGFSNLSDLNSHTVTHETSAGERRQDVGKSTNRNRARAKQEKLVEIKAQERTVQQEKRDEEHQEYLEKDRLLQQKRRESMQEEECKEYKKKGRLW